MPLKTLKITNEHSRKNKIEPKFLPAFPKKPLKASVCVQNFKFMFVCLWCWNFNWGLTQAMEAINQYD